MILVGSQRGGAKNLAIHLMKEENERVELHEVRGFASDTVMGALNEAYALSRGTKCQKFLYSLSLNPPEEEKASNAVFEAAIEQAEQRLGLSNQPRVIVFHEKNNRRHAHAVWSKINTEEMKAIPISFDKEKMRTLSRELYIQHGWKLPKGHIDQSLTDRKNFTLAEWQQAKRIGKDPRAIKTAFQDAWAISDSKGSFAHALEERGYKLARGDRRAHVAVDIHGEVHSIARRVGIKTKEVRERLGDENELPTIEIAKDEIARGLLPDLKKIDYDLKAEKQDQINALKERKVALEHEQRQQRQTLQRKIETKRAEQVQIQKSELKTGLGGLWDRLRGYRKKQETQHAEEMNASALSANREKEALMQKQQEQQTEYRAEVQTQKEAYLAKRREMQVDIQNYRQMRLEKPPDQTPNVETVPDPPQSIETQKQAYLQQRQAQHTQSQTEAQLQSPKPER